MIERVVIEIERMQADFGLLNSGGDEGQYDARNSGAQIARRLRPVGDHKSNQKEGRRRQIMRDRDQERLADEKNHDRVDRKQRAGEYCDTGGGSAGQTQPRADRPACERSKPDRQQCGAPDDAPQPELRIGQEAVRDAAEQGGDADRKEKYDETGPVRTPRLLTQQPDDKAGALDRKPEIGERDIRLVQGHLDLAPCRAENRPSR